MKGIKLCAECANYNLKTHKCRIGSHDESDPRLPFFCDCPLPDVAPVVRGEWDEIPNVYMSVASKNGSYRSNATSCSACQEVNPNAYRTNYCPNCGAKMDGGDGDERYNE